METLLLIASGIACACSVGAQISTTLNRSPTGEIEITVRNNSDRNLTAFVVGANVIPMNQGAEMRSASDSLWVAYHDSAIDLAMKALPPNQERTIHGRVRCNLAKGPWPEKGSKVIPASNCDQYEQPLATAGIYSDGSTTGNAVLLTRLMLRRSSMLMAIDSGSAALSEAGKHNYPRGQLVEQFRKLVDSVSGWYLFPEQQIGRDLFESIIGKLKNLPQGQLGEPFPPSAFIEEETARLKELRVVLWESQPSLADGGAVALKTEIASQQLAIHPPHKPHKPPRSSNPSSHPAPTALP